MSATAAPDITQRLRELRRKHLWPASQRALAAVPAGPTDLLDLLLPHREPMRLVDRLERIDLAHGRIAATRGVHERHVGLEGHFPGYPVVPGVILIEMMAQTALCLTRFLELGTPDLGEHRPAPLNIRLTKILGAHFLAEVRPGEDVTLLAEVLENDGFLATCLAQALVGERVVAAMAAEVTFLNAT